MSSNNNTLTDKIIRDLRKAAVELEEFQLQAALGKAEARDKFEALKKDLSKRLQAAKQKIEKASAVSKVKRDQVKAIIESLQLQLALGKAETVDAFNTQKKKIAAGMARLEKLVQEYKLDEYLESLQSEMKKFKVKMEILRKVLVDVITDTPTQKEKKKTKLSDHFVSLKERLQNRSKKKTTKLQHFRDEISEAYVHLKKAFA